MKEMERERKEGVVRREGKGGSGKEGGEVRKVMREKEG